MSCRERGSKLQYLGELVAAAASRVADERDQFDRKAEPGRPDDPLDSLHRGIDVITFVSRKRCVRRAGKFRQMPQREARSAPGPSYQSGRIHELYGIRSDTIYEVRWQ